MKKKGNYNGVALLTAPVLLLQPIIFIRYRGYSFQTPRLKKIHVFQIMMFFSGYCACIVCFIDVLQKCNVDKDVSLFYKNV